jgi:hypothetical protein
VISVGRTFSALAALEPPLLENGPLGDVASEKKIEIKTGKHNKNKNKTKGKQKQKPQL